MEIIEVEKEGIFSLWNETFGDLLRKNDLFKIDQKWWDWRIKNPEKAKAIAKRKYQKSKIVDNARSRTWRLRHKNTEEFKFYDRKRHREYREANKDKVLAYQRAYHLKNREKINVDT